MYYLYLIVGTCICFGVLDLTSLSKPVLFPAGNLKRETIPKALMDKGAL